MNKRPTIMEINLRALENNINEIKKIINKKEIMPIIKANAYGTFINKEISVLKEFNIVGVATTHEGEELRKIGYNNDIFILNQPSTEEIDTIVKNNLTTGVSSIDFLNELLLKSKKFKIHLEIETGMERTGIAINDLNEILKIIKNNNNLKLEGVYTHLSSADSDKKFTNKQLKIFSSAIKIIKENFKNIKYIHSEASAGIINCQCSNTNLVRPGIILYGYYPSEKNSKLINLKPICKLKTKITFLKTVPKNTPIGYSKTYITKRTTKIATISIGYADGLKRALSNKGHVVINNQKCKIIGNICMDSCMIDVSKLENVKIGDDVYIWDNKIITVEQIAKMCNTINYEILSTISNRVPRIFIQKEKEK